MMTRRRRGLRLAFALAIPILAIATYAMVNMGGPALATCFAQSGHKKCGCPVASGEKILIPCNSVDSDSCGACSVITASGQREGRPCLALQ